MITTILVGTSFGIVLFLGIVGVLGRNKGPAILQKPDLEAQRLASLKRVYASTDMTLEEFEEQVAQVLSGVQPAVHASAAFSVNPYRVVGQHPDIAWQPGSGGHSHGTVSLYAACGTAIYYPPRDLRPQAARPSPMRASRAPF